MLMQHGEHGVFSGGKYGLGRLRWAAISAARRSAIASEGLSPRDGLACTISSGAEKLSATAAVDPDNDWVCGLRRSAPVT